ncbi:MAG: hypothetical protein WKG07_21145 [Hymenobacter sp.]
MLKNANVTPEALANLGQGLNRLSATTAQLGQLGEATNVTDEYTKKVRAAANSLDGINKAYSNTVEAVTSLSGATNDAKEYHMQVQTVTKNSRCAERSVRDGIARRQHPPQVHEPVLRA